MNTQPEITAEALIEQFKGLIEKLKAEDRSGFVIGWPKNNLCVKYLSEKECNIVDVTHATVFTNEDIKMRTVVPTVTNGKDERAVLLKKDAVIDKSIKDLEASINMFG